MQCLQVSAVGGLASRRHFSSQASRAVRVVSCRAQQAEGGLDRRQALSALVAGLVATQSGAAFATGGWAGVGRTTGGLRCEDSTGMSQPPAAGASAHAAAAGWAAASGNCILRPARRPLAALAVHAEYAQFLGQDKPPTSYG